MVQFVITNSRKSRSGSYNYHDVEAITTENVHDPEAITTDNNKGEAKVLAPFLSAAGFLW